MASVNIEKTIQRLVLISALIVYSLLNSAAQYAGSDTIMYSPDFMFREGFYIGFDQVRRNEPVPPARVITDIDYTSGDFFNKILDGKKLAYFDAFGIRQETDINKIWGFSKNGVVYIRIGDVFNRVTFLGQICHFVATITTYNNRYYDPYYYNPYNYYSYRYGSMPSNYPSSEMRQYMIDFETGKLLEYNVNNLEVLLMKDPELHDEYMSLRKKKKNQLKFMYIRKFNERNPLYFPR